MKILLIFAAVLLVSAQAAKVPQLSPEEVVHRVTVPVPMNVFAEVPEVVPAVVVEVAKDHDHEPDMPVIVEQPFEEEMVTVEPEPDTTTLLEDEFTTVTETLPETTTTVEEKDKVTFVSVPLETDKVVRMTRAVPFTDNKQPQLPTDNNVIKTILAQRKGNWNNMPHRSMRSIMEEKVSVTLNQVSTESPVMAVSTMKDMEMSTMKALEMSTMKAMEMSTMKAMEMSTINPCDLLCTKFEFDPVCATNGLCLHDFPNQCILDTYNCKHPSNKFSATKDDRCQMHWLTKCDESELI